MLLSNATRNAAETRVSQRGLFLTRACASNRIGFGQSRSGNQGKGSDMAKVAFIGLGVMGFPMAGHLVNKGKHEVTVYNRSPAKAKAWTEKFGGRAAPTPREAARVRTS